MNRIVFYLGYAFRSLWRSRRWSTFALFSVAAGVATVVALRSLGLAIADSLTSNVRSSNHGDITLEVPGSDGFLSFQDPVEAPRFADSDVERVQGWAGERGGGATGITVSGSLQISALDFTTAGRPQFVTSTFIDPAVYPLTQDIVALDPAGVPLGQLFQGGNEVVISENLATSQSIQVGDRVRVSGTTDEFIVRGIVPTSAEAGLRNLFAAFFGFAYFDEDLREALPVPQGPTAIHIILPDGASLEEIEQAGETLNRLLPNAPFFRIRTVIDLLEENRSIADFLSSFIVVLGLGALLLGGVGIMNTMLVLMRRRTEEIAALKTFGLKGRQVAAMFLAEALLLGIAGSALGVVFGVLLAGLANAYGQTLIQQPLAWGVYPEALLFGMTLGLIITLVFGIIPVLITVKIRPASILRPNETVVPRLGCVQSVLMLLLLVLVVGLIAGQMLQPAFAIAERLSPATPFITGIVGVALTLLFLGILIGILWVIVWLISKLPAFGQVDVRLALRNLTTHRTRTATTLLALGVGMFALSSISFFGAGLSQIVRMTLSGSLGGNVMIFPVLPPLIANPLIDSALDRQEGVEYRTRYFQYFADLASVDGREPGEEMSLFDFPPEMQATMEARQQQQGQDQGFMMFTNRTVRIAVRDSTNPDLNSGSLIAGRDLTPEDRGQAVAVAREQGEMALLGLQVGSQVTFDIDGRDYTVEIVGLLPSEASAGLQINGLTSGDLVLPPGVLPAPLFQLMVAQIQPEKLNEALVNLSALPLVYSIDVTFIDNLLGRFISQLSAIPILVGILSLGAAAVIMANTVALATFERRRQLGILKAVGLKAGRILRVMLLENVLVSLLGSLLGIGFASLGLVLFSIFNPDAAFLIPDASIPAVLALLAVAALIGALATFFSARAALGERVTSVLRYE